jgi:MoaA/NifB/PqqE/SkfB family radical SAM enzyme
MMKNLFKRARNEAVREGAQEGNYTPLNGEVFNAYNKFRPEGPKPLFCYVPFNNMSFSFRGKTLACAYNQKVELGRYPENSVREMWFESEMGQELRNHMEHNDLSYGCKHCKYFAEHGKFSGLKPLVFDRYHNYKRVNYPQVMEFELSNVCNFECVMCNGEVSSSVRKNRDGLSAVKSPYDDQFVEQLREFIPYLKEAKFYGGEPLLIPIYHKIWELMLTINPSIRIFLITNGSVMNQKVMELLERGDFDIAVSMDSCRKDQLESIRLNLSYNEYLKNLEYFSSYCQRRRKNLVISFTMMRINWADFPEMVRFCNSMNASLYVSYLKHPVKFALWNLEAAELRNIRLKLKEEKFPEGTRIEKINAQCFKDLLAFLESAEQDSLNRDEREIIPLRATQGVPYLELAQNNYDTFSGINDGVTIEDMVTYAYDEKVDYRQRFAGLLNGSRKDQALAKCDKAIQEVGADSNLVYSELLKHPIEQVYDNVLLYSSDELKERMERLMRM